MFFFFSCAIVFCFVYFLFFSLSLCSLFFHTQIRCENILRSHPDHTGAKELHIACIDGAEQEKERQATKIAAIGTTAVAVAGFVAMALKKR